MRATLTLLLLAPYAAGAAIQVTSANLVRTPPPGILMPRLPVEAESDFLTTDPAAFYLLTWTGGAVDDKIRLEWRNPAGVLVQQNEHTQVAVPAQNRVVWRLPIAGAPAASAPGTRQLAGAPVLQRRVGLQHGLQNFGSDGDCGQHWQPIAAAQRHGIGPLLLAVDRARREASV